MRRRKSRKQFADRRARRIIDRRFQLLPGGQMLYPVHRRAVHETAQAQRFVVLHTVAAVEIAEPVNLGLAGELQAQSEQSGQQGGRETHRPQPQAPLAPYRVGQRPDEDHQSYIKVGEAERKPQRSHRGDQGRAGHAAQAHQQVIARRQRRRARSGQVKLAVRHYAGEEQGPVEEGDKYRSEGAFETP